MANTDKLKDSQKKLSNAHILKNILFDYVFSVPQVRYVSFVIIFSSLISSYFNVEVSNATKALTTNLKQNNDITYTFTYYSAILIVSIFLTELNSFVFTGPIQHVYRLTCKKSFENFIKMEYSKYNEIGCGEIQTVIDREAKAISELVDVIFLNIIPIFFTLAISFYHIYKTLEVIYLFLISATLVIYVLSTIFIVRWRTIIRFKYNLSQQACSNALHDSLQNHETVLAYKHEQYETIKYDKSVAQVELHCNRIWRSLSILQFVNKVIFIFQSFLVIMIGNYGFYTGKLTGGELGFYLVINKALYSSLGDLGFFYSRYTQAVLNVKTSFKPLKLDKVKNLKEIKEFKKNILFKDVRFFYGSKLIFKKANFEINKGEKVAIVGKNGVGKSTIIKILMKFVEFEGEVYIDDEKLRLVCDQSYRRLISYIPQSSFLFNETVYYNITYGTKDIEFDNIEKLSKLLNIHQSILNLDEGYETIVGDKGSLLSGGERQKILLMRAVLKNSSIVVMDEPTAALDKGAEHEILEFILSEKRRSTVIMIIHNLELLHMFDKVLLVKDNDVEIFHNHESTFKSNDGVLLDLKM